MVKERWRRFHSEGESGGRRLDILIGVIMLLLRGGQVEEITVRKKEITLEEKKINIKQQLS